MKIFTRFNIILVAVSIFLSGCIVQSRQLNGLLELMKDPPLDLSMNSWLIRYSDYQAVVYAVSTADGVLFSNDFGDQVLFDGWTLRKVRGIGDLRLEIDIYDMDDIRTFKKGNRMVSNHNCNQWKEQKNQGVTRYTQHCYDKQSYENSILVKKNGDISLIRQIVDERYTALILTKLN